MFDPFGSTAEITWIKQNQPRGLHDPIYAPLNIETASKQNTPGGVTAASWETMSQH